MLISELIRLEVILESFQGKYTVSQAAEELDISERRVKQLRNTVRQEGYESIICSKKEVNEETEIVTEWKLLNEEKRISILRFQKKLLEQKKFEIAYSSLYRSLKKSGIKSPYEQKNKEKLEPGNVFQLFRTEYYWFVGKRQTYYLNVLIDVSGCITGIYLDDYEKLSGFFKSLEQTIESFGIPESLYMQSQSVLLDNHCDESKDFCMVMKKMGICVKKVPSCYEIKLSNISEQLKKEITLLFMEEKIVDSFHANEFLKQYRKSFNLDYIKNINIQNSLFVPAMDKKTVEDVFDYYYKNT